MDNEEEKTLVAMTQEMGVISYIICLFSVCDVWIPIHCVCGLFLAYLVMDVSGMLRNSDIQ